MPRAPAGRALLQDTHAPSNRAGRSCRLPAILPGNPQPSAMLIAALCVALLLAVLAGLLLMRRQSPTRPSQSAPTARTRPPAQALAGAALELPPELQALRRDFALLPAEALDAARRAALLEALRRLPRPPRALQQLVSPEFVQRAASAELGEIVMGEPTLAAKVMAAVNAPLYGLQQPVTSIGQAITFLGLSSVRAQCLRHLLDESFQAGSNAALQREFDLLWRASLVATELCQLLSPRLRLGDPGTLVTLLVLSFLGRFAATTLQPGAAPDPGLLAKYRQQQQALGLAAPEIGVLLMREWALPGALAEELRALGKLPLTAAQTLEPLQGARLALCAFCTHLGERIARGELPDLTSFEPLSDPAADLVALRDHLSRPALARLPELLRGPELLRLLGRLS